MNSKCPALVPVTLSLALSVVAACSLTEEPTSFLTTDTFFQTEADLKSAVMAAYSPMRSNNLFNGWPWLSLELASDQVRIDHDEPNLETSGPDFLFYSTGSRGVTVAWRELYNIVYRSNLVLANADRVQQWNNPALKGTYTAEAKFLRAYAYLWLTKLYDDVPLLLTLEDHANLHVARTPVEQVHQQVIKDLTEAEAVLPAKWGASDRGRATQAAADMALADLYLWRASYLKKTAEWQNASDWAKKVIDSGVWGLNADYISTFLPSNKGNPEMIFYVAASGLDSRSSNGWLVNFYFPRDFGLSTGGGWGAGHPTTWHYNLYAPGDYRREAGYRSGGCRWDGYCVASFKDGPLPWKYRPTNNGSDGGKCDVDIPLYRYAEALLIYAEAQNELGNAATAVTYLNMIRARARNGTGAENRPSPADYAGPLDKLVLRDTIFIERDLEFAHEAKRWFDLVRRDSEDQSYWANSLHDHDPNSWVMQPIQTYKMRWPIPQSEVDLDPALTQNAGY